METNVLLIVGGVGVAALAVWGISKLGNKVKVDPKKIVGIVHTNKADEVKPFKPTLFEGGEDKSLIMRYRVGVLETHAITHILLFVSHFVWSLNNPARRGFISRYCECDT